jgi:hypothetical protein
MVVPRLTATTPSGGYVFRPGDVRRLSWRLRLIKLRWSARQAYDLMHLGSGTAARLCAALVLGTVFCLGLLIVALVARISAVYALSLAAGVPAVVFLSSAFLLLGPSDEELEEQETVLSNNLAVARIADEALKEKEAALAKEEEVRMRAEAARARAVAEAEDRRPPPPPPKCRCPYCAEVIQPRAVKCKHCGEFLDERRERNPASTERCYDCGSLIREGEVHRRRVEVGSTRTSGSLDVRTARSGRWHADDHTSGSYGESTSTYAMVSLCPACCKARVDAERWACLSGCLFLFLCAAGLVALVGFLFGPPAGK